MNTQQFIDALQVGKTCNVAMYADTSKPMLREVIRLERRQENGTMWLYWYWQAHGLTPWGTNDCGFSGIDLAAHGCN